MGSLRRDGKPLPAVYVAEPARDEGTRWCEQKNGGSVEAAQFKVFGDADRNRRHIDPLTRAASNLHLERLRP